MSGQQFAIVKKETTANPNKWLFSFADLISLILTFFILIFSMADPIQLTNEYTNSYNSPIAMQEDNKSSKIALTKEHGAVDNDYLLSIIKNKIANDDGMRRLNVKIIDGKLTIYAHKNSFGPKAIQAMYDSIAPLSSATSIVAKNLEEARAVAYKLNKLGLTDNLTYSLDKNLQNNIKIIIYPRF